MTEKDMVFGFADNCVPSLGESLGMPGLRVYSFEFPTKYKGQDGFVDMVLEDASNGLFRKENKVFVLEFKKDRIRHGPVDQLAFYMKSVGLRLYRPNVEGWIVAPDFSVHEIEEARKHGFKCLQVNDKWQTRFLA